MHEQTHKDARQTVGDTVCRGQQRGRQFTLFTSDTAMDMTVYTTHANTFAAVESSSDTLALPSSVRTCSVVPWEAASPVRVETDSNRSKPIALDATQTETAAKTI